MNLTSSDASPLKGTNMKNLDIIEAVYNTHINDFDRALNEDRGYRINFEYGYLCGIEYVLQQLGVDYEIDTAGYITIKQEAE